MVSLQDVESAAENLQGRIHRTPALTSANLDRLAGTQLFFKCENLQKTGAFKARGAFYAVSQLSTDEVHVVTHSSGNHGAAVAWAARIQNKRATVVCPANASKVKRQAVEAYGGSLVSCGPELADREQKVAELRAREPMSVIEPFDDARVIAGQGTVALEIRDQVPDVEQIFVPVGGGGLISGCISGAQPSIQVIGGEPELAGEASASLLAGARQPAISSETIADGLRAGIGKLNFAIMHQAKTKVVLVSEADILNAMKLLWQYLKVVVEPSGAVAFAAVLNTPSEELRERVAIVISGGNYLPSFAN